MNPIILENYIILLRAGAFKSKDNEITPMSLHKWRVLGKMAKEHHVQGFLSDGIKHIKDSQNSNIPDIDIVGQSDVASEDAKEIRVGDFVADICYEDKIIEIQNGNFTHLVPKLEAFLPKYKVSVVYPIPYRKWMCWLDPETGEQTARNAPRGSFNLYKVFIIEKYIIKVNRDFI